MAVDELLPDGVSLTPDGSAFTVIIDPVSFSESLGTLCPDCIPADGFVVPKPAFVASLEETATLPDEVSQATVADGQMELSITNGFAFDPLRPAAGVDGTMTLSLYDESTSGTLLDQVVVSGATESLPTGSTMVKTLAFSGVVNGPFVVAVELDSPAGDPVLIDINETVQVLATVPTLEVSTALVDVSAQEFVLEDTDLDLGDIPEKVVDHVQSGTLEILIENPWSVGADVDINIESPLGVVSQSFRVPASPTSTVRVEYSQAELQTFLGEDNVVLTGFGVVDPTAGDASLAPGQILLMDSQIELVVRIGGGEG